MNHRITSLAMLMTGLTAASLNADLIGRVDFDNAPVNLISSNVPTLDGGGGDTFAVGATQAWPTTGGTPFSLADNSVGNVGDTTFFAGDNEGVYGVNSNFANKFLGISDTRGDNTVFFPPVIANWTFDISGASGLSLSIDMGSMEGSTFTYDPATQFLFTYAIDGGPSLTAFDVKPNTSGVTFDYRPLDNGTIVSGTDYLSASGLNTVTKLLADTGLASANTSLDKSLSSNGKLDTFVTALNGQGSSLVLTLSANIPFEAAAFDNIQIDGLSAIPEPGSLATVAMVCLASLVYRKRK
jgi:hypothetical protein